MVARGVNFKTIELNLVGSSVFGRYEKISAEKTVNMFESQSFMVPYAGYQIAISSTKFANGKTGRAIFTSTKFDKLVVVIDQNVWLVSLTYLQSSDTVINEQVTFIGALQTTSGVVYITENNRPQILISDSEFLYVYDQTQLVPFKTLGFGDGLNFIPGYITFHDRYFICAASQDMTTGTAQNNTWRLSESNNGLVWPSTASFAGSLQTKPDNVRAVVRFPSKGNMIFVMGSIVTEAWFDTGKQLFPYERNTQFNIDYGCLSPATVAYMDQVVVWLAQNEKSGPTIMYSDGGMPQRITTDGIDFLFSELQNPQDSQGFLYRQDGHLFYHINFYSDNLSLFYDFNNQKFYHACDQNLNYFIAAEIAFYGNQYYFVTRNNGNMFAFDTSFVNYQDVQAAGSTEVVTYQIPRIRTCKNIRFPGQDYFIANDVGFTIESGETDWYQQKTGPIEMITQDGIPIITQQTLNTNAYLVAQDLPYLVTQDMQYLITEQGIFADYNYFIYQQEGELDLLTGAVPAVDMSVSYDGGASFSAEWRYNLPPIGKRKNRLKWWQLGIANDMVFQFKFWSVGRVVISDGEVNIRV